MLEQLNPPCVRSVSGCFLFAASSPNRSNRNITSVSPAGLFNLPSSLAPLVFPTVSQLSSKVIQETGETHTHTHTNDSSWISLTSVLIGLCCWSCRDTKSTEVFPSSHLKVLQSRVTPWICFSSRHSMLVFSPTTSWCWRRFLRVKTTWSRKNEESVLVLSNKDISFAVSWLWQQSHIY